MGQSEQDVCLGVATALTIFSTIVVALRQYTRSFIIRNSGKDDVFMVIALSFTIAYLITIFILKENGMGFTGMLLTPEQKLNQIQTTLAIEIIYYFTVNAIKISILFFYLRIAVEKKIEQLCKGTIYFLATFCIVCVIVCFVQCVPLHKFWDFTGQVPGTCINTTAFFYTTSSINILLDIWILVLPVTTLLKIQRPGREKLALIGIFGLGVFSTIASIVRLYSIRVYTESKDPFFDSVPINTWSMVEINIGILCASFPATKALFSKNVRERGTKGGSYQYHSRERSVIKSHGKSGTSSGVQAFAMKDVESSRKAEHDYAAPSPSLGPDLDVDEQRLVWPQSRL